jgi:Flp pilus assembly protein TadG
MRRSVSHGRKGAIVPLAAIMIVVMIGMVAFAVDLGYLDVVRTELQLAADAAVLAGAEGLLDGPAAAKQIAQAAAQDNRAADTSVVIVPQQDIELGHWNDETLTFTPVAAADEPQAEAIRVTCRCIGSRSNSVSLFFAPVLGTTTADVVASAVARRRSICGNFIGVESVELNGNQAYTDSYNASLGTYGSQTPGDNGHLCSDGDITVQNGTVNGDATPGAGHSVSIGQGGVTGSTKPRTKPLKLPPVDFGNVEFDNDNHQVPVPPFVPAKTEFKKAAGSEVYLPPGTYYFTKFTVNSDSPIRIDGPVQIYVSGNVSLGGGSFLNQSKTPSDLQIFCSGKKVSVSGHSNFYGIIYAPSSDIEVAGGADFYGAAVGATLKFHNDGGIHADQSVGIVKGLPTGSVLVQ